MQLVSSRPLDSTSLVQCKSRLSEEAGSSLGSQGCPWDLHSWGKESPALRNLHLRSSCPSLFLPNPERKGLHEGEYLRKVGSSGSY